MLKGARKLLVAVFLGCSLSFSADMNPLHDPGKRFTQILGVDLMEDRLDQVLKKLGKSPVSWTGDASEAEGKACYLLADGTTTIEFVEWELGSGCVVRMRKRADTASCTQLKRPEANRHFEINGLRLGMSRGDVLKILGEPKTKNPSKWIFDFQGRAHEASGASRFGKGQEYFWQFLIKVTFDDSAATRLELHPTVQQ